jgi:hypothetical protein
MVDERDAHGTHEEDPLDLLLAQHRHAARVPLRVRARRMEPAHRPRKKRADEMSDTKMSGEFEKQYYPILGRVEREVNKDSDFFDSLCVKALAQAVWTAAQAAAIAERDEVRNKALEEAAMVCEDLADALVDCIQKFEINESAAYVAIAKQIRALKEPRR